MKDLNIGDRLGSYELVRKLGEGGMGMVFAAVNPEIERHVAIKVLHAEIAQNRQALKRLFNEARAANRIDHPGVVQIHECVGSAEGSTAYLVMELLHGVTLSARLAAAGGLLAEATALRIAREVADLLAAAHRKQIIHRDLKPENVMLVPDPAAIGGERVKVLDFGIAKFSEAGNTRTGTNLIMGTPRYMSPEQCRGAALVDERTDVYALGVMLFQMVGGCLPFDAATPSEILYQHVKVAPPELLALAPQISHRTAELVMAMLRKEKEQRPTMVEVAAILAEVAHAGEGRAAPRAPEPPPSRSRTMVLPLGEALESAPRPREVVPQKKYDLRALLSRRVGRALLTGSAVAGLAIALSAGLGAATLMPSPGAAGLTTKSAARAPLGPLTELLHNTPASVKVSSSTRASTLGPRSLVDGDLQTAWNSRAGDLVGASVTFTVPDYARVHTVQLTAGFPKVNQKGDLFTMNHRITAVTVFREDALIGRYKLDPNNRELQELRIDQPGGRFELQVEETVPGSRSTWREVCISELQVWGFLPAGRPSVKQEPTIEETARDMISSG